MEAKKKNVSLRMSQSDIDKVKAISDRLGVKEADILRFAVKQILQKLAPFQEESYRGIDLMPALLEVGEELVRFFDFNTEQLAEIINDESGQGPRNIDLDDLKLLALSGVNGQYARLKLNSQSAAVVDDEASFKAYFMNKYFATELPQTEKKVGEWKPFLTKSGDRLSMPKTA
ncbi:MAG: hypothetical protein C9356_05740 [Oleiphilus sp.]|nr:MAG: hypothetical protein C9356_05740 [Oleiphilus sp.]